MKYSIKQLAKMYNDDLTKQNFDVKLPSQYFDPSTYNEYTYQQLMKHYDKLYEYTNCVDLTEEFLKGDTNCK